MSIADLEIGLHRRDEGAYAVELRFNLPADAPEDAAEINPITGDDVQITFDFEALRALKSQPAVYGKSLSDSLFAGPVASAFASARAVAASAVSPLRLRLFIGPSAPELHNLGWETLQDPDRPTALLSGENIIFSRYLSSEDWRPVTLRPKRDQRVLVVVANPTDLEQYRLAAVDVDGEVARARASLGQVSDHRTGRRRPGDPQRDPGGAAQRLRRALSGGPRQAGRWAAGGVPGNAGGRG